MDDTKKIEDLIKELGELRIKLREANDTLEAIRTGQVDALIVEGDQGHQLYTLKTADQTYRVFIEKMREGAVALSKNALILYCNSRFAEMVGQPVVKIIGMPFEQLVPEDSRSKFKDLFDRGWESDSKGEISLLSSDNTLIPFLLSFASLELDEGMAMSVILTDLTIQKENERQLQIKNAQLEEARQLAAKMNEELEDAIKIKTRDLFLSREHFKFLADNIPVIVWTTQADGSADYFNNLWFEFTGLSGDDNKAQRNRLGVVHPDDIHQAREVWAEAIKSGRGFQFESRLRRSSDQQYRWHLSRGEPFRDESGELIAWFGTSVDIEDQKKEIERKDEFISVASHELKTPLTSLKGYIQLIEKKPNLPDDVKLYIARANGSLNKLQHLINDLLDVSKIKAGKLKFSTESVDLVSLINSCVENCTYMYPAFQIKKEMEENAVVSGNPERLEQVLMNLINNAVKYSPDSKSITVRLERDTNFAIVSVIDNGIGMSKADQKRIFERFYRAEDNKFLTPGLGMGLYISAEIIKEHRGQFAVKSKLNEGSVFSFSLPLINTQTPPLTTPRKIQ